MTYNLKVSQENEGSRIDSFLANEVSEISRSAAQLLIENGAVLVNGKAILKSCKLKTDDELIVEIPKPKNIAALPQKIDIEIVYEDDDIIVVNKPKGMVVHPAMGNPDNTLVNALLYHCEGKLSGINGEIRPGIVHRIDKDTSGLLVVAKTNEAHISLCEQLAEHSMTREYCAVVYGRFKTDDGFIDNPIGRSEIDRKKFTVNAKSSKTAYTSYTVLERFRGYTMLSLKLKTGRTHQIRVHLSSIGHPVAGDLIYGPKKALTMLKGQCLHAKTLGFIHPKTNEYMEFTCELPQYFVSFIQTLPKE